MLITVADLIDHYIADNAEYRQFARSTMYQFDRMKRTIGHVRLTDFDFVTLRDYCRRRYSVDGVAPSTVMHDFAMLRAIFTDRSHGHPLADQCEAFATAKYHLVKDHVIEHSDKRTRRVSVYEENALCHWANAQRGHEHLTPLSIIIPFAISTALRQAEICRCTWADFHGDTLTIRDRKDPRKKRGNHQTIPLFPRARNAINAMRPISGDLDRIFPYVPATVGRRFRRAADALHLHDIRFHDLRHEGISRMFEAGMAIQEVAAVSGHKSWGNLRRYTHLTPQMILDKYARGSVGPPRAVDERSTIEAQANPAPINL